jgi:hypothetical protein
MALTKSDKINLVQLAMKRVNVVPYEENQVAFGTNTGQVELSDSEVTICESYINVTNENRTCHVGFSAVLSAAVSSEFYLEVDGTSRAKKYPNTNATMQFMDFFLLGMGLHHIAVKAKVESLVTIAPREARLGVYL